MDGERTIKFGLVGSSDIIGLLRGGRFLGIEVKTPTGRQSPEQVKFENMIRRMGGLYVLARSVDDVWEALREYAA